MSRTAASGSNPDMGLRSSLRASIERGRERRAWWVGAIDTVRLIATAEGRGQLWTRMWHGRELHQTTPLTGDERYPELFDFAANLLPEATRILSFGCSTGEELAALRRRFPAAKIVGAEINPRSRRIATRRLSEDGDCTVVPPSSVTGAFDVIFALAVLQREPERIRRMQVESLSTHYSFGRFDKAVGDLVGRLKRGGLLCVFNAHYPIEASSAFNELEPVPGAPLMEPPLFGRDGRRLTDPVARTVFRKRP